MKTLLMALLLASSVSAMSEKHSTDCFKGNQENAYSETLEQASTDVKKKDVKKGSKEL